MQTVLDSQSVQSARAIFGRAAALLASSAGFRDTLEKTLATCLPTLGDFGFFDARDEAGVVRISAAHDDERIAAMLRGTQWVAQKRDDMNLCALTTGLPALHAHVDDAWYRQVAANEAHLALLRSLAFRSMITVPMHCRGELIGALTLFMGASGRRHTPEHLALAADLAGICAPAVANAALVERSARAESALRDSESRIRLSYEAAGMGAWSWDIAGNQIYWSPEYREICGLDAQDTPSFAARLAVVLEEDRAGVVEALRGAVKQGREYRSEHRIRHPRKGVRWIQGVGRTEFDRNGVALRVTGMVMDVTERREAERARAHMAAIVESSDDAIMSVTLEGIIKSWNPGAARLYGYAEAEMLGQSVARLIPPELQAVEAAMHDRVRRGERIEHYETTRIAKDGRRIPVSLTVSPVRDAHGAIAGISKIARDITERQRADQELRLLRDQLAEELEAMRQLQLLGSRLIHRHERVEDLLGEILEAALRITGVERGAIQLLDSATGELRLAAQHGFCEAFVERFGIVQADDGLPSARALRAGARVIIEDLAAAADLDGEKRDALVGFGVRSVQCTPLITRAGRLVGVFTTHGSLVRRPSERELRMLDLLSRTAADLIERAQVEASLLEADRRKDEFLAILAHELRNPLAPIRYAVSIAREPGSSEAQRRRAEAVIERQVRHMSRLLDDLLDVSRIARGMVELKREAVDVAGAIATAVEASRPLIEAKGHDLAVEVAEPGLVVDADPVRLTQILTNLVTNAAKYTDEGGRIRVSARLRGDAVELSVADTGIGISESMKGRLFQLFARAESAAGRSESGLGIGLALVKAFVELHGGTIEARSEGPNRGAEFVVTLPGVRPAGAAQVAAARTPAREPMRRLRVLVADDNQDVCETCATLLRLWGHEAHVAHDGAGAIRRMEQTRPDVALLDIGMPDMDGYHVARHVRAQSWGAGMVLVAITGWGQTEAREESSRSGFDRHLTKPVDAVELERVLAAVQQARVSAPLAAHLEPQEGV